MFFIKAIGLIVNGPPPTLDEPAKFSNEFKSFISDCLIKDPNTRKNASDLLNVNIF